MLILEAKPLNFVAQSELATHMTELCIEILVRIGHSNSIHQSRSTGKTDLMAMDDIQNGQVEYILTAPIISIRRIRFLRVLL